MILLQGCERCAHYPFYCIHQQRKYPFLHLFDMDQPIFDEVYEHLPNSQKTASVFLLTPCEA